MESTFVFTASQTDAFPRSAFTEMLQQKSSLGKENFDSKRAWRKGTFSLLAVQRLAKIANQQLYPPSEYAY
ncbi:hypothetical protein NP233_g6724 [Leucocoprinus birnbaumii]|uniref:Uncharacterized protein n=1 Tax=Leucocoprinus birnbaumii TaxID=56174 RepID=A0AAD5VQP0_9AGAR|nr:hypothetical protein NP233_g6724 [Leucocoprinus birnbaumii]